MNWFRPDIASLLAHGLVFTLLLTAVTSILSLLAGIVIGALRLGRRSFRRRMAGLYIELFRNIPALVLIIFFAFALPNLAPPGARQRLFFDNLWTQWGQSLTGLSLPYYFLAAAAALTLNTSAYLAELFRAGVGTIPQEYVDAARSLGASPAAVFRQILLPGGAVDRLSGHHHPAHSQYEEHGAGVVGGRTGIFPRVTNGRDSHLSRH